MIQEYKNSGLNRAQFFSQSQLEENKFRDKKNKIDKDS